MMSGFATYQLLHSHESENSICNQEGKQVCSSSFSLLLLQNSKSYQEQQELFCLISVLFYQFNVINIF